MRSTRGRRVNVRERERDRERSREDRTVDEEWDESRTMEDVQPEPNKPPPPSSSVRPPPMTVPLSQAQI
eukprot:6275415-Karenia_brevis.AAC.1